MNPFLLLTASSLVGLTLTGRAALVSHYTFDEAAGATSATNEVSGATVGDVGTSVTTGVTGISGNAYSFTGGSAQANIVDMGNASFLSSIQTSGQYTFSLWVSTSILSGPYNVALFAGNNADSNDYIDVGITTGGTIDGQAYMRHRVNTNSNPGGAQSFFTGSVVADGSWHHVVMTGDTTATTPTMTLFLDGVQVNSATILPGDNANGTGSLFPVLNNFEIGRLGRSSPTDAYEGLVDDVQIYDSALSPAQVGYLFNNPGLAVPEPGVAALAGLGLLSLIRRRRA